VLVTYFHAILLLLRFVQKEYFKLLFVYDIIDKAFRFFKNHELVNFYLILFLMSIFVFVIEFDPNR